MSSSEDNAETAEALAEQMKSAASWWLDAGNEKEAAAAEEKTKKVKSNLNWWEASSPDVDIDEISGVDLDVYLEHYYSRP